MSNEAQVQVEQPIIDRKTRVKSIIGGSAGNLVEWYDWYVYAAFTLYFAPQTIARSKFLSSVEI